MANYQPNYQQVPPPPLYATQTSTLAIVSLIAGIAGWVGVLGIGPIIAIICGHMAKNEIRKANGRITGGGLATAGLILGYLNLALSLIVLCLAIVLPLLGIGSLAICAPFLGQGQ
jgi:hypothetical protein